MSAARRNKKPVDAVSDVPDEVEAHLLKAAAICALVSLYEKHWDEVADGSLADAMWAAQDHINKAWVERLKRKGKADQRELADQMRAPRHG